MNRNASVDSNGSNSERKTEPVYRVYFDTVVYLKPRRPTNEQRRELSQHCRRFAVPKRRSRTREWRWKLYRPTTKALELMALWGGKLQVVDAAFDLLCDTEAEALRTKRWFETHHVHKWRRQAGTTYKTTTYSTSKTWGGLNWVSYSDKPSRHTGDACCHLELRIRGCVAVKRAGLSSTKLPDVKPEDVILSRLTLRDIDLEHLGRIVLKRELAPMPWRGRGALDAGRRYAGAVANEAGHPAISVQSLTDFARPHRWLKAVIKPAAGVLYDHV